MLFFYLNYLLWWKKRSLIVLRLYLNYVNKFQYYFIKDYVPINIKHHNKVLFNKNESTQYITNVVL